MKIQTSKKLREKNERTDRLMKKIITVGGYGIIISILAILLFLLYQSLPLSKGAEITQLLSWNPEKPEKRVVLNGTDEYMEIFYLVYEDGLVSFYSMSDNRLLSQDSLALEKNEKILTSSQGKLGKHVLSVGTNKGKIYNAKILFRADYSDNQRKIVPVFSNQDEFQAEVQSDSIPAHIENMVFRENENGNRFWAWINHAGQLKTQIYDSNEEEYYNSDLTKSISGKEITVLTISYNGENLIAGTKTGEFYWFDLNNIENIHFKDRFKVSTMPLSATSYLLGDNAILTGDTNGEIHIWLPVRTTESIIKYRPVRKFESLPGAISQFIVSPRNRGFLAIDKKGNISYNYSTTDQTLLKFSQSDHPVQAAALSPKDNGILITDTKGRVGKYLLDNPHPETTLGSLFSKVWYEGYSKPEFVWQSTGGSDEFEPKLSLIPLIVGTVKGTFYAMLFSVPIALLAAIYISQFAPGWMARTIKPTIEILAAFPSVVIGFLAGLYFSPLFDRHLINVFLIIMIVPIVFLVQVFLWSLIPERKRIRFPKGTEILITLMGAVFSFWIAGLISQPVELFLFDGNIKEWIYSTLGETYDSRNSIVVGLALGFAVTPIIFTVSEDALSNVPDSLTSASLATGASIWQTVWHIVLPAAAGGIFAAIMLGFGRAIGETMIVLMATGNTPILDFSPFNGFRAMSACIAVEIPEAPVGGTLYRVLFLTALLLFIFTFTINSVAAFVSDKLRRKYSRF